MATVGADPIAPAWQRRLRVDEYHRMIEAGVFDEDERIELLDGILVSVSPQGAGHAHAIAVLTRILIRALGDEYQVRPQLPLTLGDRLEPEPDLAVVRAGTWPASQHPSTALLVVEVSAGSSDRDRTTKAAIYAGARIPEYWIVDLATRSIEVFREPDPERAVFNRSEVFRIGQIAAAASVPGVSVPVADLV